MGDARHSAGWFKASERRDIVFTMDDVRKIRDSLKVGDKIKFRYRYNDPRDEQNDKTIMIKGTITRKFPNILVLDKKHTYNWKDLLLGGVEVIE